MLKLTIKTPEQRFDLDHFIIIFQEKNYFDDISSDFCLKLH